MTEKATGCLTSPGKVASAYVVTKWFVTAEVAWESGRHQTIGDRYDPIPESGQESDGIELVLVQLSEGGILPFAVVCPFGILE